jgi:hypothetical protein
MALTRTNGRPWLGLSILFTLPLWLGVMNPIMAGTVHCKTREDPKFTRLGMTYSDSSRTMTRDDEPFKR